MSGCEKPAYVSESMAEYEKIRLSVVVPAFNASAYILECLLSVISQEFCPAFEIIVVDDGSTDDTAAVVTTHCPEVRFYRKSNGGPGSARNFGAQKARGEILVFIDADDVMLPGRLAFQGSFMLSNPLIALSFGNQQYESQPNLNKNLCNGICRSDEFVQIQDAYAKLLVNGNYIANTTCAVRNEVYRKIGGQPTEFFVGEDYAMNCAISRAWPIAGSNRFLTWYRQNHGGNLMASRHAYRGPVLLIRNELILYQRMLKPNEYTRSFLRWCGLANMLLRWLWIEEGHSSVCTQIDALKPLLPRRLRITWWVLSLMPTSVGRSLREVKQQIVSWCGQKSAPAPR
jgi:glycosyltransferase involved in cell wall biosynthesis